MTLFYIQRVVIVALVALHLSACNPTKFNGTGKAAQDQLPSANAEPFPNAVVGGPGQISIPGTQSQQVPTPIQVSGKSIDLLIDAGDSKSTPGQSAQTGTPLSVYFAMDITGSMMSHLNKVKENMKAFTNALAARGYDTRFGGMTFMDAVSGKHPLGSAAAFTSFLDATKSPGLLSGGKWNEASLLAFNVAIDDLIAQETRPGALMAIVLVTDNPGHKGNDEFPDCGIQDTVARLNALPLEFQRRLRFYYSVPANAFDGTLLVSECGGFKDAKAQMEALSSQILLQNPPNERVGALQWKAGGLEQINQLVSLISANATPAGDEVCLAQDVTVSSAGRPIFSWRAPDMNAVYQSFLGRTTVKVPAALNESNFTGASLQVDVDVNRCCVSSAQAAAGQFTCTRISPQKVTMTVTR